jgi:hypothetical protein
MDIETRQNEMEKRMDQVFADTRERLAKIETRLDQTATKADVAELSATLVKWIVGMATGMGIAGITVMTFVLNNAVPKSAPVPPPAPTPIVIQLPPYK